MWHKALQECIYKSDMIILYLIIIIMFLLQVERNDRFVCFQSEANQCCLYNIQTFKWNKNNDKENQKPFVRG